MDENFSESGQTAVEYLLMLMVAVVICLGIMKRVRAFLVGPGDCPNESYVCKLEEKLKGPGYFNGNYRYFTLKR